MKTIVKIIWFSLAFTLSKYVLKYITTSNINLLMDKLNAPSPIHNFTSSFVTNHLDNINQILLFTIMFLGLDIISGDIKGAVKGPFRFILNTVLYLLGFTIIFNFIDLV